MKTNMVLRRTATILFLFVSPGYAIANEAAERPWRPYSLPTRLRCSYRLVTSREREAEPLSLARLRRGPDPGYCPRDSDHCQRVNA